MAEKSEKATPKKLRDARKKGQVAKAQDLPAAATFVVSIMGTLAMLSYLFEGLGGFLLQMFRAAAQDEKRLQSELPGYFLLAAETILRQSLPIMVIVCFIGVLVNFLVIGPVFSFEAMKFDLKKLNPIEGIKAKFKLKVLVELLKSMAKIIGAGIIIYMVLWSFMGQIISTVAMPIMGSAMVVHDFLFTSAVRVGIFFVMVGLFDLAFQKRIFATEMKMEKFEVKQEYKDTEGDPHIKSRRREMLREIAYQEGPRSVRKAKAVITNPIHIAVALKYDLDEDPAPMILTMGTGLVADQIIKVAIEYNVPVMRNVELARDLYNKGEISRYIPEETYEAVAEILKWIKALEANPDIISELRR